MSFWRTCVIGIFGDAPGMQGPRPHARTYSGSKVSHGRPAHVKESRAGRPCYVDYHSHSRGVATRKAGENRRFLIHNCGCAHAQIKLLQPLAVPTLLALELHNGAVSLPVRFLGRCFRRTDLARHNRPTESSDGSTKTAVRAHAPLHANACTRSVEAPL